MSSHPSFLFSPHSRANTTLKVPTRKEVQIMLAEQELRDSQHPEMLGASEWISTGLRIEETKLASAFCRERPDANGFLKAFSRVRSPADEGTVR